MRHLKQVNAELAALTKMSSAELERAAQEYRVPLELVEMAAKTEKLPVPVLAAGGVATPADAALVRQLGAESVFVGSGIFKSESPPKLAKAIVATAFYDNPKKLLQVSRNLGKAMPPGDEHNPGRETAGRARMVRRTP